MAGRSSDRSDADWAAEPDRRPFARGRLVVGIVVVTVLAAAAAFGVSRLRGPADAGRLVYVSDRGLVERELASGNERVVAQWPQGAVDPRLSADRLAYQAPDASVVVVELSTGRTETVAPDGRPAAWNTDGTMLAIERSTERARSTLVADVGGRLTEIVPGGLGGPDGDPVWLSPDRFAVRLLDRDGGGGALFVIALSEGVPSTLHQIPGAEPLAASPDGAELLYAPVDGGELQVLRTADLSSRPTGLRGVFSAAAVNRDGVVAVTGQTEDGAGLWVLTAADERPFEAASLEASAVTWSADGSHVLYLEGAELFRTEVPRGLPEPVEGVRASLPWLGVR